MQKKQKLFAKWLSLPQSIKIDGRRRGSKISLYLRPLFEHKHIKKLLGTNILGIIVIASISPNIKAANSSEAQSNLNGTQINLQTQNSVSYPVKNIIITQGYSIFHPAIDFDGITGDPIYPIKKGIVISTNYSRFSYGNHIIIDHGGGITSLYAHLSKIKVNKGDLVDTNTIIGDMGATGRSFGDHLHLEVHENGQNINPIVILQ